MKTMNPFTTSPPETLIIRLHSDSNTNNRRNFKKKIAKTLPYLNWRSHIYVINDDPAHQIDSTREIIQTFTEYLNVQKLSTIYIHPFIRMPSSDLSQFKEWESLFDLLMPFQREAYDHQNEVRILFLPIMEPQETTSSETIISGTEFLKAKLAKPRLYVHGKSNIDPSTAHQMDMRVYVDPSPDTSAHGIISQLWMNHVFDDIQKRVEEDRSQLFAPCSRHLIFDEKHDAIFPCFAMWQLDRPMESFGQLENLPKGIPCVSCISDNCLAMEKNLRANTEREERNQVFLGLGIALSKKDMHKEALPHARKAFELSVNDDGRAMALLHQGLCHMSLMEFALADKVFKEGATYSSDTSIFAYHRGNAQFAQQNYLKAIEWFQKALETESPEVPMEDLLLNLAVSYINIEAYGKAHHYLDGMTQVSAPIRFYQGVCDLSEGHVDEALAKFSEALALGPASDDLSKVLFYMGTCHKELGQYDKAITALEKAVQADSKDYMNFNLLGFCLFQLKEHEKAIEAFQNAVEINPDSALDYASIGSNLRELGRLEDAIVMYHKALSLDPSLSFAQENIEKLEKVLKGSSEG